MFIKEEPAKISYRSKNGAAKHKFDKAHAALAFQQNFFLKQRQSLKSPDMHHGLKSASRNSKLKEISSTGRITTGRLTTGHITTSGQATSRVMTSARISSMITSGRTKKNKSVNINRQITQKSGGNKCNGQNNGQ